MKRWLFEGIKFDRVCDRGDLDSQLPEANAYLHSAIPVVALPESGMQA